MMSAAYCRKGYSYRRRVVPPTNDVLPVALLDRLNALRYSREACLRDARRAIEESDLLLRQSRGVIAEGRLVRDADRFEAAMAWSEGPVQEKRPPTRSYSLLPSAPVTRTLSRLPSGPFERRCHCGKVAVFVLVTLTEMRGVYAGTGKFSRNTVYRCPKCTEKAAAKFGLQIPMQRHRPHARDRCCGSRAINAMARFVSRRRNAGTRPLFP
ncbi:hypothetical protein VT84_02870 [Gemmata sp. SH-PL17]|nr:hypothetical protein VT84_02870 [Gemmata sp. SH-PL17]